MLSRRRFLGSSGLGMIAVSAGCRPSFGQESTDPDTQATAFLSQRLKNRMLGYPINMNTPPDDFFAWREQLNRQGIDMFAFNNVGNPFKPSPIPYNTHDFERKTIQAFGRLFEFPVENTWGFLSHSGTDSNMHGMYMGRTVLKGRAGVVPKAYFTKEAHYSIQILSDLLGLEDVIVATLPDGAMDPDDLAHKLADNADAPALVVATVGTTFKGAIDDVDQIQAKLRGYKSYVHVDAALFGGYLPFTPHAATVSFSAGGKNGKGRYDSIAVSCHKFFGFPNPAGLFITKSSLYREFNALFGKIHSPDYIHQVPGTITCSRDATKPAEFYYFAMRPALSRQAGIATLMLKNASYLMEQLSTHLPQLTARRASPLSNTVYFKKPSQELVDKYSLATMTLNKEDRPAEFAHVVVMPHVSRAVLTEFLGDLKKEAAGAPVSKGVRLR